MTLTCEIKSYYSLLQPSHTHHTHTAWYIWEDGNSNVSLLE